MNYQPNEVLDLMAKVTADFIADERTSEEMVRILAEHTGAHFEGTEYKDELLMLVTMNSMSHIMEGLFPDE